MLPLLFSVSCSLQRRLPLLSAPSSDSSAVRGVQGVPPGRRPVEKAASVLKKGIDFGPNSCFFYVLKQFSPAFLWILPSVFLWTVCYNDVSISPPYGLCTRRAGGLLHPAFFHFCALLSRLWAIHRRIPPPGSSFVLKRRCPAEWAAAFLRWPSVDSASWNLRVRISHCLSPCLCRVPKNIRKEESYEKNNPEFDNITKEGRSKIALPFQEDL